MLINCPRCGFSQPQDEYCANCGINMEKYIPERQNLAKSLISNTLLQALVLIAITVGSSYFLLKQSKSSFKNSINQYSTLTKSNSLKSETSASALNTPNKDLSSTSNPNEDQLSIESINESQATALVGTTAPETPQQSDPQTKHSNQETPTKNKVFYKLSYYEVDARLIEQWSNLNQSRKMENLSSGLIPTSIFKRSIKYPALKSESIEQEISSSKEISYGYRQANSSFQGHILKLTINSKTDSSFSGNIQIYKSTNEEISTSFAIQKDSLFFIHWSAGLTGLTQDNILSSHPPFQILDSNQFLSHSTDLLIVLESTF